MIVRVLLSFLLLCSVVSADRWVEFSPSQSTYVYLLTPSTPYGSSPIISSANMFGSHQQNALVQWDVTSLEGEVIKDAYVICSHFDVFNLDDTINMSILTPSFGSWNSSSLVWDDTGVIGGTDIYPPYIRGDITEFGFTQFHELGGFGVKDIVWNWVYLIENNGVVFHLQTQEVFGYWTIFSSPILYVLIEE